MDTAASEFWNKELGRYDLDFKSPAGDASDTERYVSRDYLICLLCKAEVGDCISATLCLFRGRGLMAILSDKDENFLGGQVFLFGFWPSSAPKQDKNCTESDCYENFFHFWWLNIFLPQNNGKDFFQDPTFSKLH